MPDVRISLGGEGDPVEIAVTIVGCPCRAEDYLMSLVAHANDWKRSADEKAAVLDMKPAPCGCKEKRNPQ